LLFRYKSVGDELESIQDSFESFYWTGIPFSLWTTVVSVQKAIHKMLNTGGLSQFNDLVESFKK
jgi:hypothetical protein